MNLLRLHSQDAIHERMEPMKPAEMDEPQYKGIRTHSVSNLSPSAMTSSPSISFVRPLWQPILAITFQTPRRVVRELTDSHLYMPRCVLHALYTV